jgi:hypothetical protein
LYVDVPVQEDEGHVGSVALQARVHDSGSHDGQKISVRRKHLVSGEGHKIEVPADLHVLLCRLLRNRVSAQQARERKKQFVNNLETKNKQMEQELLQVKEHNKKLQRDNDMLRQVIKNMKPDNNQ